MRLRPIAGRWPLEIPTTMQNVVSQQERWQYGLVMESLVGEYFLLFQELFNCFDVFFCVRCLGALDN